MNDKSLNYEKLEDLFQKYENFENINRVRFLGKVSPSPRKKKVNAKAKRNPNFRSLWDGDINDYVRSCRVVLDFPTITGRIQSGKPAVSRIATFTTFQPFVDGLHHAFREMPERPKYIIGVGHLQNYKTVSSEELNKDAIDFINDIADRYFLTPENTNRIFEILGINSTLSNESDGYRHYIPQNVIWATTLADGDKEVARLAEKGQPTSINNVLLQGLVYMPPAFKSGFEIDGEDLVQFKIRVRRFSDNRGSDDEPETDFVPMGFASEDGYDYFDVIGQGPKVREWFDKVKQGHPVRVQGGLEVISLQRAVRVNFKVRRALESVLGCDPGEDFWKKFSEVFENGDTKVVHQYPLVTVRASEVITDF